MLKRLYGIKKAYKIRSSFFYSNSKDIPWEFSCVFCVSCEWNITGTSKERSFFGTGCCEWVVAGLTHTSQVIRLLRESMEFPLTTFQRRFNMHNRLKKYYSFSDNCWKLYHVVPKLSSKNMIDISQIHFMISE